MKAKPLFAYGKTNQISAHFNAPVHITGFNLRPYSQQTTNGIITARECGDYIYFEEMLFDGDYELACHTKVIETGAILSEVLRDECGRVITLDACRNHLIIDKPGIYRAVYVGSGRPEAAVVYVAL